VTVSNRLAYGGIALACVIAAGAGGYLAERRGGANAAPATSVTAEAKPLAQPVEATDTVLTTTPPPPPAVEEPVKPVEAAPKPAARSARPAPRPRRPEPATARSQPPAPRSNPSNREADAAATVEAAPPPAAPPRVETPPLAPIVEPRAPEPPPVPERTAEELVVAADSVIGLQIESAISSERARVEDGVEAKVVRDVRAGGTAAVPAGSRAIGSVMAVERGGKFKDRARLGIRFHTLVLADGTRLPITTETIYRQGDAPSNSTAAKIGGGAVAGAILGAIVGGAKGAAVGATAGAGGGTAVVMAGDRRAAEFAAGTEVTTRLLSPVTVTVER
jgi:type IV secretory pathway VirB10-like protein